MMYFNTVTPQNLKTSLFCLLLHCSSLWHKYWLWYNIERELNLSMGLFVQFYKTHRLGRLNGSYKNPSGLLVYSSSLWNTHSCILLCITKDGVNPLCLRWLEENQLQSLFLLSVWELPEQPEAAWPGSPGGTDGRSSSKALQDELRTSCPMSLCCPSATLFSHPPSAQLPCLEDENEISSYRPSVLSSSNTSSLLVQLQGLEKNVRIFSYCLWYWSKG